MSFKILDANDREVGKCISIVNETLAYVEIKINNIKYILPISPNGFTSGGNARVLYTEPDCAGQRYVEVSDEYLFPIWTFISSLNIWVTRPKHNSIFLNNISVLSYTDGSSCTNVDEEVTYEALAAPIEDYIGPNFMEGFIAPFRFSRV